MIPHANRTTRDLCITALLVMLLVSAAGAALVWRASPARATTRQLQWNIQGWEGGHYGSPAVDYSILVDIATYESTEGVPRGVSIEELCWSDDPSEGTDQYDGLASYFYPRGYVWWAADLNDFMAPSRTLCHWQGVGIWAAANSQQTWGGAIVQSFTGAGVDPNDNSAPRKLVCLNPVLGYLGYGACVTHLPTSTSSNHADYAQQALVQVRNTMNLYQYYGHPASFLGGDFNLSTQNDRPFLSELWAWYYGGPPSTYARYESCSDTLNTFPAGSPDRKIDYVWFSLPFSYSSSPCITWNAGSVSDHRLLHGRFNMP